MGMTEVQPLIAPPAPHVEDVDTKSIRVPVVHPPLPEPVPVTSALAAVDEPVIPKRPNFWRRVLPLSPIRRRRHARS